MSATELILLSLCPVLFLLGITFGVYHERARANAAASFDLDEEETLDLPEDNRFQL